MHKIVISILGLSIGLSAFGQQKTKFFDKIACSKLIGNGTELYNAGRTSDALMTFKQAKVKDPNSWKAHLWLATSEFDINSYSAALEDANKAMELTKDKENSELLLLLGRVNHKLGNIEAALAHFKKAKEAMGDREAKEFDVPVYIAQCEFALNQKKDGVKNIRKPLSNKLNTKFDEYGPVLVDGGKHLFFTARNSETTGNKMNPEDQRFFEDIYHAVWNPTEFEWDLNAETLDGINTEGFDAINFMTRDGLYGLGTINTSASKEKTTTSSEIFEMNTDIAGTWGNNDVIKNPSINSSYFEGAACITDTLYNEDESYSQTMYFVSDRNGDKSLTDIYTVDKKNNVWGIAKELPKSINTNGRETTPFITPDGKYLFFSSDALPGMGGYDIYYVENQGNGKWSDPVNLGATFNTVDDDTHFQFYKELGVAVLAGIAESDGVYNYDLFKIDLKGLDFPFLK